ncbi:MAG: hypothetical protein RR888_09565 [Akkermansia sp.]
MKKNWIEIDQETASKLSRYTTTFMMHDGEIVEAMAMITLSNHVMGLDGVNVVGKIMGRDYLVTTKEEVCHA